MERGIPKLVCGVRRSVPDHGPARSDEHILIGGRARRTPWRVWHHDWQVPGLLPAGRVLLVCAPVPHLHVARFCFRRLVEDQGGVWSRIAPAHRLEYFPSFGVGADGEVVQYVDPVLRAVPLPMPFPPPLPEGCTYDPAHALTVLPLQPPSLWKGLPTADQCRVVKELCAWLARELRVAHVYVDPMYDEPGSAVTESRLGVLMVRAERMGRTLARREQAPWLAAEKEARAALRKQDALAREQARATRVRKRDGPPRRRGNHAAHPIEWGETP